MNQEVCLANPEAFCYRTSLNKELHNSFITDIT